MLKMNNKSNKIHFNILLIVQNKHWSIKYINYQKLKYKINKNNLLYKNYKKYLIIALLRIYNKKNK